MTRFNRTLHFVLLAGLVLAPEKLPAQPLLHLPLHHWSYEWLDRFETKGWLALPTSTRPLRRDEISAALGPLAERVEEGSLTLTPQDEYGLRKLRSEFLEAPTRLVDHPVLTLSQPGRDVLLDADASAVATASRQSLPRSETDVGLVAAGGIRGSLAWEERLGFRWKRLGSRAVFDPQHDPGRAWRGAEAVIERAYVRLGLPWFELELGREPVWWGSGTQGTLLLSDNALPLDFLGISVAFGAARFEAIDAAISSGEGRFFSGHRLTWSHRGRLTVGLSEVVVYAGERPDPSYLNPLIPFYAAQWNRREDDNILWAADWTWIPLTGLKSYGEVLIDDYMYDPTPPAPDKRGFLCGLHVTDPASLPNTDLRLEYARLDRWVYTHRRALVSYVDEDGAVLGHRIGPDADLFTASAERQLTPRLRAGVLFARERHGEGRSPSRGWTDGDDPRTQFLSGVVERRVSWGGRLEYEWSWRLRTLLEGSIITVANSGNHPGRHESRAEIRIGMSGSP